MSNIPTALKIRRILLVILIVSTFGSLAYLVYRATTTISKSSPDEIWKSFSGAFFGALVGLIFIALTDWVKGIFQKARESHDSLVHLELFLNEMHNNCFQNIRSLSDHREHIKNIIVQKPQIIVNPMAIFPMEPLPENWKLVRDIELINKLFALNIRLLKVRRYIDDTEKIKEKTEAILKEYPHPTVDVAGLLNPVLDRTNQIIGLLGGTKENIIDVLVFVRIKLKATPASIWLTHRVLDLFKLEIQNKDIEKEKIQILSELEVTLNRSKSKEEKEIKIESEQTLQGANGKAPVG